MGLIYSVVFLTFMFQVLISSPCYKFDQDLIIERAQQVVVLTNAIF